jgi:TRAP-type C4-dicarboxylate transport system permease small subunit
MDQDKQAEGWLGRTESSVELAASALALFASGVVFLGVVLRNVFDVSPSWIVEAPTYAVTWAVFLMLVGTFRRGLHLGLDIAIAMLPLKIQHAFGIFASVATAAVAGVLVWIGTDLTLRQYIMGATSNTALRMPLFAVTAAIPTGCSLLLIHSVVDIVRRILKGPEPNALVAEASV